MSKLDKNKQYKLRNGNLYRHYSEDNTGDYPIHGAYSDDGGITWHICSHTIEGVESISNPSDPYGLVEITPYSHFNINDPVVDISTGKHGHFAGLDIEGNPLMYNHGRTSWTDKGQENTVAYYQIRAATPAELTIYTGWEPIGG